MSGSGRSERQADRTRAARRTWAAVCAAAAVVLGPAAATASALGQANAAPPHHPDRAGTAACPPVDTARRRTGPVPPASGTATP
ncbi:hypothetical protein ACWELO_02680 [Streptomyces sp. NPDC004596]|uniref:hypothetical protein n=1 Tax=Streptomyces sp. DSM 118148 TaxID=3448667 RepID=UPI00403FD41B